MILLTGGTGYIGSHTCVELISAGYDTLLLDNLSTSSAEVTERIGKITGKRPILIQGDIRDPQILDQLFASYPIDAVMHFAGLKSVGESVTEPLAYYDNNVNGTLVLLRAMNTHGVRKMVFSSSATVYGKPPSLPIREDFPLHATNPYGRTKLVIEEILGDLAASDPSWRVSILRYFNPVGAHESGLIGESPKGAPNNLMPYIAQVAAGQRDCLKIYGNDYPTPDGTGIRDYIHVTDLAKGHIHALQSLNISNASIDVFNLGTGRGYSVLEVVKEFEKASGEIICYEFTHRRKGDVAAAFADPIKAHRELGWKANKTLYSMCLDAWKWQCTSNQPF